jgi:hypothetical protein
MIVGVYLALGMSAAVGLAHLLMLWERKRRSKLPPEKRREEEEQDDEMTRW